MPGVALVAKPKPERAWLNDAFRGFAGAALWTIESKGTEGKIAGCAARSVALSSERVRSGHPVCDLVSRIIPKTVLHDVL
jgi:uncharacterized membrane protein